MRNTKVIDVIHELSQFGCTIDCYDPWVNLENVKQAFKINRLSIQNNINMMLLFLLFRMMSLLS